jgi:hypothetical protein
MHAPRHLALLAAVGCAAPVYAQPTLVNLSGATLLENFLRLPAATNDYLDCDGNGIAGSLGTGVQNLAANPTANFTPDDFWVVTYRLAGSVAGYQELVSYGSVAANCGTPSWPGTFTTGAAGLVNPPNVLFGTALTGPIQITGASKLYYNGVLVYDTSGSTPTFGSLYREQNPAGLPVGANLSTLQAVAGIPAMGGYRVDVSPVDVPSTWAVWTTSGAASPLALPGQPGYGRNPRVAVNPAGLPTNYNYLLADLGPRNLNTSSPDCNTIFDSPLFFAPVGVITSHGTGIQQMDQSDLNHFFATGRLRSGENLIAVTREIGSGTRNGFNNTSGIDPSWGVGDNVGGADGQIATTGNTNILGNEYAPGNKVGNGDVETTIRNTRLGIGYAGAERFTSARAAQYELISIRCSLAGGTAFTRPTLSALLNNRPGIDPAIWSLGGPSIFATVGDPRQQSMIGGAPGNTHPRMANAQAAAFVNNITRSIEAFQSVPNNVNNVGMPGELAATLFIPLTARPYDNDPANPSQLIPNPSYNASLGPVLATYSVLNSAPVNAPYGSVSLNGQTPFRKNGVGTTYTDGVANGAAYLKQDGSTLAYNVALPARNRIAGDFNGDGRRDINDAPEMMKAYRSRNGGPAWVAPAGTGPIAGAPGSDAIIEVLGDFNGDGNFTAADIRYWADGLGVNATTGILNRRAAFAAVDNAWLTLTGNANFFGTTVAGGRPYTAGDSAADVAGAPGIAPGWAPVGADGVIDAQDLAYLTAQRNSIGAAAHWAITAEAVRFDLSADITGDLIVDQADIDSINAILGAACYANCDGSTVAPILNVLDFNCFLNRFAAGDSWANCDNSTIAPILNILDFSCFLNKFAAGCP